MRVAMGRVGEREVAAVVVVGDAYVYNPCIMMALVRE